ncbi:MAG: hypothetical protein KIT16_04285 [Rhodospirillaceae bacterium]|nr:hypothetical protein [Rhodospirillaceae bacterium]
MAWMRTPLFLGAALLFFGLAYRIVATFPDLSGAMPPDDFRQAMTFQQQDRPLLKLEPRYRPYAVAFMLASSEADIAAIKKAIDAELAAAEAIRARGFASVMDVMGDSLADIGLVAMAAGAALVFRSLSFVLALGFGAGALHQMLGQTGRLTGAPSEIYLGAILAALAWCTLFWAVRAVYERRLRFGA